MCGSMITLRERSMPAMQPPAVLGQDEEPAVGGVHLEPQVVGVRDVGDVGEGVDRARVRRAGGGDDEPRMQAGGDVRLHRVRERVGVASASGRRARH